MVAAKLLSFLACAMAVTAALSTQAAGAAAVPTPTKTAADPAPSPSKGSAVNCSAVMYDMTDCLEYVSPGSKVREPSETCCEGIKAVVGVSPLCLCEALQEAIDMGVEVDMAMALQLPGACKLDTHDLVTCTVSEGATAEADTPSPLDADVSTSTSPPSTSDDQLAGAAGAPPAPSSDALPLLRNSITHVINLALVACFYF